MQSKHRTKFMGVRRREQNEHFTGNSEIGTKSLKFLENLKSTAKFLLVYLILAVTIYLPVSHLHCTRVRFTVLESYSSELVVHSSSNFNIKNINRNYTKPYCIVWMPKNLQYICFKLILINYEIAYYTVKKKHLRLQSPLLNGSGDLPLSRLGMLYGPIF